MFIIYKRVYVDKNFFLIYNKQYLKSLAGFNMRIKAVDIAKKLNISKASVSLALNGKPGVSRETREAVFKCKEELENSTWSVTSNYKNGRRLTIKVIVFSRGLKIIRGAEFDLWADVLRVFDSEAKRLGYSIGITYTEAGSEDIIRAVEECNTDSVAGVILDATEMTKQDFESFKAIKKPMVIYDNDFDSNHHSVVIDNAAAVCDAVSYLAERRCRNIKYLCQEREIYNFIQRRIGFKNGLIQNNINYDDDSVIPMGTTVLSVEEKMNEFLKNHSLPDAFIMENYQISIGVLNVLQKHSISVPDQVSLLGIDELPYYVSGNCSLTTVKVSHTERAAAVMMFLIRDIENELPVKFNIRSKCTLIEGNSVRKACN